VGSSPLSLGSIPGQSIMKLSETWKQIQNTTYQASSLGKIRRTGGKVLAPSVGRGGYLHVGLRLAGRKLTLKVHYLVCVTFWSRPAGSECVRHLNGDSQDNRSCNLRWGTNLENAQDTILHGRQVCGFDHPGVKITKVEARTIRATYCRHMEGKKKAKNGFILNLVEQYPQLGYRCVYRAATGSYDEME